MRDVSPSARCLASITRLRWLVVFSSALLVAACHPSSDRLPNSPSTTPPGNANELVGPVHRVESDRVFHVRGQRVEILPNVAVSEVVVVGSFVRVRGSLRDGEFRATEIIVLGDGPSYQLDGQIEAMDAGSRTMRLLGLELRVHEVAQGLGVGQWVSVRAHRNLFGQSASAQVGPSAGGAGVEGGWFRDVAPPTGFTLLSVVDFPVQVSPTTEFVATYHVGDGECYGADALSADEFWTRAGGSRPMASEKGSASVSAVGRFEGGSLIAKSVWVCYP